MGWSCSAAAGRTLDAWGRACVAQTGSQNEFSHRGNRYFFETSSREHEDGAITGTVFRMVGPVRPDGSGQASRVGSFRIAPDGSIARAPRFLATIRRQS